MSIQLETLGNYRNLVAKVDELCIRIATGYGDLVSCRKGCDGCCRHLSLFPVEAYALSKALRIIPEAKSDLIRRLALSATPGRCPLLDKGICLLYPYRPIICRTHGLPLLVTDGANKFLDYCPKNFQGLSSFPAADILNLELLNSTLAAINALFIDSWGEASVFPKDRLSIAEALLLDLLPPKTSPCKTIRLNSN